MAPELQLSNLATSQLGSQAEPQRATTTPDVQSVLTCKCRKERIGKKEKKSSRGLINY